MMKFSALLVLMMFVSALPAFSADNAKSIDPSGLYCSMSKGMKTEFSNRLRAGVLCKSAVVNPTAKLLRLMFCEDKTQAQKIRELALTRDSCKAVVVFGL